MANVLAPFGLSHIGSAAGESPTFGMATRRIAFGNATKIFHGDLVENLSTGYIAQWVNGHSVAIASGVFVGCYYLSTAQGRIVWSPYWPGADTAVDAWAQVVPLFASSAQFLIQCSASTFVTLADAGATADIVVGTGSTITGISGSTLGAVGTTATFPFRVVGPYEGVGNGSDATTANNWAVVQFNAPAMAGI